MSTSMTVWCRSIARPKLCPRSTSLAASPSASTSSANASRVTGSAWSQTADCTKAKRGGSGGSRRRRRRQRRARDRPRVRVLRVETGHHLGEQRGVLDRAREHPDMIERARQQQRAGARNKPMGRLEADHAAEGGRPDGRAVGLRADRARHHEGRDRRRRAARRAARRARLVVRIAGLARMEVGVFGGDGLAHDHRAGGAQPRHGDRVAARRAARPERRAELGRHSRRCRTRP